MPQSIRQILGYGKRQYLIALKENFYPNVVADKEVAKENITTLLSRHFITLFYGINQTKEIESYFISGIINSSNPQVPDTYLSKSDRIKFFLESPLLDETIYHRTLRSHEGRVENKLLDGQSNVLIELVRHFDKADDVKLLDKFFEHYDQKTNSATLFSKSVFRYFIPEAVFIFMHNLINSFRFSGRALIDINTKTHYDESVFSSILSNQEIDDSQRKALLETLLNREELKISCNKENKQDIGYCLHALRLFKNNEQLTNLIISKLDPKPEATFIANLIEESKKEQIAPYRHQISLSDFISQSLRELNFLQDQQLVS